VTLTCIQAEKKDAEDSQVWKSVMVSLDENAVGSSGFVRGRQFFNLTLGARSYPGSFGIKKNLRSSFVC
jgi:hypothetical protein